MRIFLIVALCSTLFTACEKQEPATNIEQKGEPATTTWPATKTTNDGSFLVTISPSEGAIGRNEHFSLDLTIKAPSSETAPAPFTVKVDADMPAHQHGMNTQPELVPQGEHKFRVDGMLFHMAGEWVIMVDVTSAGKTERVSFAVQVE